MIPPSPEKKPGPFQRYAARIGIAALVIGGLGVIIFFFPRKLEEAHKVPPMSIVSIPPPPPPPPQIPPPPIPPPPEQKMVEQTPVKNDVLDMDKDDSMKATDKAADDFGLTGTTNGRGTGGGAGRWGWYAASVQSAIRDALHRNEKTRNSGLGIKVRVWPDRSGRITRCELSGSTGDAAIDSVIKNDVLNGLQLSEPPPDMPRPLVILLSRS